MSLHKPVILVSSCLLGNQVRYDGQSLYDKNGPLRKLAGMCEMIAFCPEVAGGLSVPRAPVELVGGSGINVLQGKARALTRDGTDCTEQFLFGARAAHEVCVKNNVVLAILTERSPSCGSQKVYNGTFTGELISGSGVTAALLRQHNYPVFSHEEIDRADTFLSGLDDGS